MSGVGCYPYQVLIACLDEKVGAEAIRSDKALCAVGCTDAQCCLEHLACVHGTAGIVSFAAAVIQLHAESCGRKGVAGLAASGEFVPDLMPASICGCGQCSANRGCK